MSKALIGLCCIIVTLTAVTSFAGPCGDVNNSGTVNALDVTYLINFLYKGGQPPFCGTVTDIDGNVYQTVKIGTQWWMLEDLKVTHYRNGDAIPNITDSAEWIGLSAGAFCDYNNDPANSDTYGRLYNWYAVNDSRNIAPVGWHVPSDEEWKTLEKYLGMSLTDADLDGWRGTSEGGKMKESGTAHWYDPNIGATNESGFTGLPAGYRDMSGSFIQLGYNVYFWSSTEGSADLAWFRGLFFMYSTVGRTLDSKLYGFSIRCVKN